MKKVIGILGVAVLATAMFLNTNAVNNSTEDTSLSSLIALNTANAETPASGCYYTGLSLDMCSSGSVNVTRCIPASWSGTCGY